MQDTIVIAPIVSSPVTTMNEHEEPILQDPIEPIVTQEEEQQQPYINKRQLTRPLEDLKESENQPFLMTTKSMNVKKNFKCRVIPPHLKKL